MTFHLWHQLTTRNTRAVKPCGPAGQYAEQRTSASLTPTLTATPTGYRRDADLGYTLRLTLNKCSQGRDGSRLTIQLVWMRLERIPPPLQGGLAR